MGVSFLFGVRDKHGGVWFNMCSQLDKEHAILTSALLLVSLQIVGEIKVAREALVEVTARLRSYMYKEFFQRDMLPPPEPTPGSYGNGPSGPELAGNNHGPAYDSLAIDSPAVKSQNVQSTVAPVPNKVCKIITSCQELLETKIFVFQEFFLNFVIWILKYMWTYNFWTCYNHLCFSYNFWTSWRMLDYQAVKHQNRMKMIVVMIVPTVAVKIQQPAWIGWCLKTLILHLFSEKKALYSCMFVYVDVSLLPCSGRIQVPMVTRSTLEVVIPDYAVTRLMGKSKNKLAQISEVIFHVQQ